MLNKDIEAIVFDFGNVIIDIDLERTFQAFSTLIDRPIDRVKSIFENEQLFRRYEIGLFEDSEFRDIIRQALGFPFSDVEINNAWNALLLEVPYERIKLVQSLRATCPVYLLSNTNNIHIESCNKYFKQKFGIAKVADLFDEAFYSYEMGLWKPQNEIYETLLEKIGLKPNQVLFVDDNKANIESASKMGIQTIHLVPPDHILNHFSI